jgi:hypothetical protein
LVKEWHDNRLEEELNTLTVAMEMKAMEKKVEKYNVGQLGKLPIERGDGAMRVLVNQMGGCASMETREMKIAATKRLIRKYNINVCAFMELNSNWAKVNSSANLASWFQQEEREICCISAHNMSEFDNVFGKHQPGRTGLLCRHKFLQYAKKPLIDPRELGRWCSWPFSCNPSHVTCIVVAYRPCASKVKGLKTVYQQHLRYIQSKGLKSNPVELFNLNLSKQITEWRGAGERIVLVINLNSHPLHNTSITSLRSAEQRWKNSPINAGARRPPTHIMQAAHQLLGHTNPRR